MDVRNQQGTRGVEALRNPAQPDGLPPLIDRSLQATKVNGVSKSFPYDLSIVIPVYNEEAGIRKTVENLHTYLDQQPWRTQVICVDDGSDDGTAKILADLDGIQVVVAPENRGYGSALKLGFAEASGRYVGFIDADQTYPVKMIGPMIALLESRPDVPLCAGSRLLGRGEGLNFVRKSGNFIFTVMSRLVCRTAATDVCTGMLVFRNELMSVLEIQRFTDDLDFSLQMRCRCAMNDIPNLELPIPYDNRAGDSKLGVVRHGLKFTARILKERLRKH